MEGKEKKVLYTPDIDAWKGWDIDIYDLCRYADICILDGTFYDASDLGDIKRDIEQIPHPFMTETMNRLERLVINGDTEVYFTHFNHPIPY